MGNIFTDLFTNDNEEEAARQKAEALRLGQATAGTALDTGFNNATGYYDKALVPFSNLYDKGSKGYDTFQDATGVNGAGGIARAGDLYRSLPGYNAGRDMGINDLERRAAARGQLGGGNTSADTIKFASDYDSTKYKDFISSLVPNLGVATGAAAGQGGILGQEGNLAATIGGKKADYAYGTEKGIGDANADATMANEKSSSNFWSALMGAASLAAAPFTGGASLAGLGALGKSSGPITTGGAGGPMPFY